MMRWETGTVTVLTMLALQACAPEPPPEPKPSDGFLKVADQAFVNAAWTKVAATYDKPGTVQYRALTISEDAGEWTLCGESAEPDQLWRGFLVTQKVGDPAFDVLRQNDQISPRAMKACKPLVRKYMGEKEVDSAEASRPSCRTVAPISIRSIGGRTRSVATRP